MSTESYLDLLEQSLRKKRKVLDRIQQKSMEQHELLQDPNLDPDIFDQSVEEKASLIEELTLLDQGFEQTYLRIKAELEGHKEEYKEQIKTLQNLIADVIARSTSIQTQEARNKDLAQQKFASVRKQVREVKASQKAVNNYYQSMMGTGAVEAQFMDNKK